MAKIWVDDIRTAPEGYIWCRSVNEAKEVMYTHPFQMIPPGAAVMAMSLITALLSDNLRDVLDPQHTLKEERG